MADPPPTSHYCIVTGCTISGSKGFFSLPKDKEEAKLWLRNIGATDDSFLEKKYSRICYRHFSKDMLNLSGKYYKLKKGRFLHRATRTY